jgi:predicted small lipoprotein YifL
MNLQVDWMRKTGLAVFLLAALFMTAGCGVKAPPIPPERPAMPRIDDLSGTRRDFTAVLTWTHPAGYPAVTGYAVMQLKNDIGEPPCPQCPQQFEQAASVPVPAAKTGGPVRLESVQPLQSGFNYTFKVRPLQASGALGPDSNLVAMETGESP